MIEKNKCPSCKYIYEVAWDDDDESYYADDESNLWSRDNSYDDELYPEYCPFCGLHREYGGEEDASDDF